MSSTENAFHGVEALRAGPPPWLEHLGTDALGARLGIVAVPSAKWTPAETSEANAGTLEFDHLTAANASGRAGKVLVARGPSTTWRALGVDIDVHWYADAHEPDRIWCASADFYPAWLWVAVEPTPEGLAEVLSRTFPKPALRMVDFTRRERGFVGFLDEVSLPNVYSGDMVKFNGHNLDRYCTMVRYVEKQSWGSHHSDDPLRDTIDEPVSHLVMLAASKDGMHKQQRLGRVPSMTWRTLHSRSYVSFEIHMQNIVCVRLSYVPAPASHRAVVARCNAELGFNLPVDVPLDVLGTLTGIPFNGERDMIENITAPDHPGQLASGLRICAALWEGDLGKTMRLCEYTTHSEPTVRRALASIALYYHMTFLLYRVALSSDEPAELRDAIDDVLEQNGSGPDATNVFRDTLGTEPMFVGEDGELHDGIWPDGDDDDEDAEDEVEAES